MDVTVIIPTFNESLNVEELVRRLTASTEGISREVIFVDDSTDATPEVIRRVAAASDIPVRLIHRDTPTGGLGGAVIEGLAAAKADVCVVMDGDLQHPPADVLRLYARYLEGDADAVVASRYTGEGTASGLAGALRVAVSRGSTAITKAMFPLRLRNCTDPMTGFFLIDRRAIDLSALRPKGFKILLEILARHSLRIAEISFRFADRHAGDSKASLRQGMLFLRQLTSLRFGKMSAFALVGAVGAIANVGIVWLATVAGMDLIWAAILAAEVTIVGNFIALEYIVFREMKSQAGGWLSRFIRSAAFNNVETAVRIPIMSLLVDSWHISSVLATAVTLAVAFVARFVFHSLVVYSPRGVKTEERAPAGGHTDSEELALEGR